MIALLDKYSLDTAEDLLGTPKDKLLRYASEGHISLAVSLHSLGCQKFNSLYDNNLYDLDHFERAVYMNGNLVDAHESSLLNGKIPIAAVQSFTKYPIGHSEYGLGNEIYVPHFDSEKYMWWLYEKDSTTEVFLTKNAILSSPITQRLFLNQDSKKSSSGKPVVAQDGFLPKESAKNEPSKYQVWQSHVNAMHEKHPHLTHSDISKRLGKELGVEPETIRRRTNNPRR